MDNKKIVDLLKILKEIYVCDSSLVQDANIDDLNAFLEENGVNTLDVLESCLNVKYILKHRFEEKGCEKTVEGIKHFFDEYGGFHLSDNEANGIYEKYIKGKES